MKKRFDLQNKNILVTGAGGIIGSQICLGFLEAGAKVAMVDLSTEINQKAIDSYPAELRKNALNIACDIANAEQVKLTVEKVIKELGHIDVLHNNAAGKSSDLKKFFAPFEEYSLDQWRQIMSVNVDGMFLMAQAVGSHMAKRKKGSIIQTASIYGVAAPDQRIYEGSEYMGMEINTPAVYSASKGAVVALTRYLATYWAKDGVRVNTITPGGVESGQNERFIKQYSQRVPLGRMAKSDEMVGAVLFLASDEASYITGQNLIIDGGLTTW